MATVTACLPIQITTGILCASYWRGAWYVLDYTLFPTDRVKSGFTSLAFGGSLLALQQYMLSPSYNGTKFLVRMLPPPKSVSLRTHFIKMNRRCGKAVSLHHFFIAVASDTGAVVKRTGLVRVKFPGCVIDTSVMKAVAIGTGCRILIARCHANSVT